MELIESDLYDSELYQRIDASVGQLNVIVEEVLISKSGEGYYLEVHALLKNISTETVVVANPMQTSFDITYSNNVFTMFDETKKEISFSIPYVSYFYIPSMPDSMSDFSILSPGACIRFSTTELMVPKAHFGRGVYRDLPSGEYSVHLLYLNHFFGLNVDPISGEPIYRTELFNTDNEVIKDVGAWVGIIESDEIIVQFP